MPIDLGKKSGAVSLNKGDRVTITKTNTIQATVSFSADTDYDVYAIILTKDGREIVCSTFGSDAQPIPTDNVLGVRHLGDVTRGGTSNLNVETLEITLTDEVDQIAVVAYSAQSNGSGSFKRYQVSTLVDNGNGTKVTIPADQANPDDSVYTCVPAIIHNSDDGVTIERVEMYSSGGENRPTYLHGGAVTKKGFFGRKAVTTPGTSGVLVMDAGSKNKYK